ncbi:hypothetical protein ACOMHN_011867 [Nucella lapillus]
MAARIAGLSTGTLHEVQRAGILTHKLTTVTVTQFAQITDNAAERTKKITSLITRQALLPKPELTPLALQLSHKVSPQHPEPKRGNGASSALTAHASTSLLSRDPWLGCHIA